MVCVLSSPCWEAAPDPCDPSLLGASSLLASVSLSKGDVAWIRAKKQAMPENTEGCAVIRRQLHAISTDKDVLVLRGAVIWRQLHTISADKDVLLLRGAVIRRQLHTHG